VDHPRLLQSVEHSTIVQVLASAGLLNMALSDTPSAFFGGAVELWRELFPTEPMGSTSSLLTWRDEVSFDPLSLSVILAGLGLGGSCVSRMREADADQWLVLASELSAHFESVLWCYDVHSLACPAVFIIFRNMQSRPNLAILFSRQDSCWCLQQAYREFCFLRHRQSQRISAHAEWSRRHLGTDVVSIADTEDDCFRKYKDERWHDVLAVPRLAALAHISEADVYNPESPEYNPESPEYNPGSPEYHPESPEYNPGSPGYEFQDKHQDKNSAKPQGLAWLQENIQV
jgi:hypothetical protein